MMLIDHLVVASWFSLCKIVLAGIEVSADGQCQDVIGVDVGTHGDGSRRDARKSWKTEVSKASYDDHGRPNLSPRAELCRSFPAGCPLQDLHQVQAPFEGRVMR